MHIVIRVVLIMDSLLKGKNELCQLCKFLSASAWSSLKCSDHLQKALPADLSLSVMHVHFQGKQLS